ncbi:hypothetical protein ACFSF0_14440 [Ottowia flava]|uniref:Uncharacterized protein n=1 Tax=Ottowia flava TaxID=2675430 RepID=A0ABW4KUQ6_9BURK|nr:hypothetical protein [Ottowia sp. GY511]
MLQSVQLTLIAIKAAVAPMAAFSLVVSLAASRYAGGLPLARII